MRNDSNNSLKLFTALHRLGRQMHRCAHHIGHAGGYYREQSRLLLLIAENDGVIQRDLAEEMDVRPSSMTEMLAKMEQLGLVERKQDEKDQRVMHIFLTEQGKSAVKESQDATRKMTDTLFGGLSGEEISQMLILTEKLCTHLDAIDSAGLEQEAMHHGHHRGFGGCRGFEEHLDFEGHHHGFNHF
ncbi:MarR family transcriptional regulator [Caproiciproducens sp. NJN-50]|uniref:MarR family winged helix-turn-helix transcriptional regulator n=1 Tax=Acutalibacteraceae TaxID=3082771 RepID=UPI000FFE2207|nr:MULTISPECIES: MarR family transcriptional regulator [Acutalibacteraceae]QAT50223.1 MarR family transcriptional regulator [Caproiciproducens sp. NJN-50]